jgi:uncharacterized protein DUF6265
VNFRVFRFLMLMPLVTAAGLTGTMAPASGQQPAAAAPAAAPAAATAIGSAPRAKATLDQVAWIAGPWAGTLGDRKIEQHWMAPDANSMVAMYRSIQKDRATLYELLAIEQDGESLSLRIKHFAPGPGLAGREAKDESNDHALVRVDGRTAVFEGTGADNPPRVTFTSPNPDTLTITVERMRDGKLVPTEFRYSRIKS